MVEFNFNISSLFPEDISIITNDLIPLGYSGADNYALLKKKVCLQADISILKHSCNFTQCLT